MRARNALLALLAIATACTLEGPPLDVSGDAGTSDTLDVVTDAAPMCPAGSVVCDRVCVHTASDNSNCGACGVSCPLAQSCRGGACRCAPGLDACVTATGETSCVTLASDERHCGACNRDCPGGQVCAAGACAGTCGVGQTQCSRSCVTLTTDRDNCGTCGHACLPAQVCVAGACGCPSGLTDCGGTCVDAQNDPTRCGMCGRRCEGANAINYCAAGSCRVVCNASYDDCDRDVSNGCETRVAFDSRNCGRCGVVCPASTTCSSGACMCNTPGLTLCDGRCVNLMSDVANCGRCGHACTGGRRCYDGDCEFQPP